MSKRDTRESAEIVDKLIYGIPIPQKESIYNTFPIINRLNFIIFFILDKQATHKRVQDKVSTEFLNSSKT